MEPASSNDPPTQAEDDAAPPWRALEADWEISSFLIEYSYFKEFVVDHAGDALAEKLMDPDATGSHNWRVALALSQLNKQLALAIQAVWESHLRRWLRSCAKELHRPASFLRRIQLANITALDDLLLDLRLRRLADLTGNEVLQELVLVGNVVRHGDGPSAVRLNSLRPDIWLNPPQLGSDLDDIANELSISDELLQAYAEAISDFWLAISALSRPPDPEPWQFEDAS
jgi:hypothetical protein